MKTLFTSESVTNGHADKICDQIADSILDEIIEQDPTARVACEVMATASDVLIGGEITTTAKYEPITTARKVLDDIGYYDYNPYFTNAITTQSPDIALGTNDEVGGAGDQGLMFGYACKETPQLMPLPIILAHEITGLLERTRKAGTLPFALPDGKSQVTVEYENGKPVGVDTVVVSTQHTPCDMRELKEMIERHVITPVLQTYNMVTTPKILINPTGSFLKGGPEADTGLTGRKIIVDTYGGYALHGGGAFSGKDPTKVDRSGAYIARHIAKTIVANGVANWCEIQLAYAIGVAEPVSIAVMGDLKESSDEIIRAIRKTWDLTPKGIIDYLNLRRPIYRQTASGGHFGRTGDGFTWEQVNKNFSL